MSYTVAVARELAKLGCSAEELAPPHNSDAMNLLVSGAKLQAPCVVRISGLELMKNRAPERLAALIEERATIGNNRESPVTRFTEPNARALTSEEMADRCPVSGLLKLSAAHATDCHHQFTGMDILPIAPSDSYAGIDRSVAPTIYKQWKSGPRDGSPNIQEMMNRTWEMLKKQEARPQSLPPVSPAELDAIEKRIAEGVAECERVAAEWVFGSKLPPIAKGEAKPVEFMVVSEHLQQGVDAILVPKGWSSDWMSCGPRRAGKSEELRKACGPSATHICSVCELPASKPIHTDCQPKADRIVAAARRMVASRAPSKHVVDFATGAIRGPCGVPIPDGAWQAAKAERGPGISALKLPSPRPTLDMSDWADDLDCITDES